MKIRYLFFLLLFVGCKAIRAPEVEFPSPVPTTDVVVQLQERIIRTTGGVSVDNTFSTARLNQFEQQNDSTFRAVIAPENEPINPSPWYAFKIWSDEERNVDLILDYVNAKHRYDPKVSYNGWEWTALDSSFFSIDENEDFSLKIPLSSDTLWIAAQAPVSSLDVADQCGSWAEHPDVNWISYGKSKLGRDLSMLTIGSGKTKRKPTIVLLCRQHPPEVTGWHAFTAFVDALLAETEQARQFRANYRVLLFPLLNPDGVDLGFWRHNAGGVDLNRDWSYYRQPEIRQTVDYIYRAVKKNRSQVLIGLDFHSTWHDVYYTNEETELRHSLRGFKDEWLSGIRTALPDFSFRESPSNPGKPVSKSWFLLQFGALGITYEIGDDTPPEVIEQKGRVSAEMMMRLLLEKGL